MKIITRLIAMLAALSLALTVSAYAKEDTYTKKELYDYTNNIKLLLKLNVLEGERDITQTVTRAEFAKILMSLIASDSTGISYDSSFDDVTEETNYSTYIYAISSLGILNGYNDNTFAPNNMITFEEAIAGFVNAMGYSRVAQQNGGYPNGHIITATQIGLLSRINVYVGYPITSGALVKMIINSFGIKFMVKENYGNKDDYVKGENQFIQNLKIAKKTGIVKATEISNLINNKKTAKNIINIDDVLYSVKEDYTNTLGYFVEFYINTENHDNEILYINKSMAKNEVLTVLSDDLIRFNNRKYEYMINDKQKQAEVSWNIYTIYNGKSADSLTNDDMMPKNGSISLLDNNADGKYDVLFIDDYITCVVYGADEKEKIIYDTYDSEKTIKLSDDASVTIKNQAGLNIPFANIKKWDVLSVKQSIDNTVVDIILCKDILRGRVDRVSYGDKLQITVSGNEYNLSKSFNGNLNIGRTGLFLFDHNKKIVAFNDNTNSGFKIGYLVDAQLSQNTLGANVELKIFSAENEMIYTKTANKIWIDNQGGTDSGKVISMLKKGTDDIVPQVILFSFDAEGNVDKIDTPYNNEPKDKDAVYDILPKNGESDESLRILYPYNTLYYREAQMTFDGKINLSNGTVIFSIPTDLEKAQEDDFQVISSGYLDETSPYYGEAYSIGANNLVADVLVLSQTAEVNKQKYGIITKVTKGMDGEGEPATKIEVTEYNKNSVVYVYTEDLTTLGFENGEKLSTGNFIKFSANSKGKVSLLKLIYDATTNTMKTENPSIDAFAGNYRFIYGKIYEKQNNVISITTKDITKKVYRPDLENHVADKFKILSFNPDNEKITQIDINGLADYKHGENNCSQVLIYTYFGEPRMIVKYN